ncbi:MAG: hypothetical protein CMK59_08165 [Proteobacteria bacterium]|nr:hypothetical protein [Pseudomonadota bacterium]
MCAFGWLWACNAPESDEDCLVYYDKCEMGCEPLCGTARARDKAERGGTCDIGCLDTATPECVFEDGECQWQQ